MGRHRQVADGTGHVRCKMMGKRLNQPPNWSRRYTIEIVEVVSSRCTSRAKRNNSNCLITPILRQAATTTNHRLFPSKPQTDQDPNLGGVT
jgi:hypothetical protein